MQLTEFISTYTEPFALLLARFAGLCIFAPVLSTAAIPVRAKVLLVFMLAVSAAPAVLDPIPLRAAPDLSVLAASLFSETMIGLTIGLIAVLPLYAAQLAGFIIDHQVGIGLSASYNPLIDSEGGVIGDIIMYMSLGAFLSVGGLDALYTGILNTYTHIPLGSTLYTAPLTLITSLVTAGFDLALRIAAPVLCMILIELVASTFIMKTMPQLSIMSVGFPIKVLVGLFAILLSLRAIGATLIDSAADNTDVLIQWTLHPLEHTPPDATSSSDAATLSR